MPPPWSLCTFPGSHHRCLTVSPGELAPPCLPWLPSHPAFPPPHSHAATVLQNSTFFIYEMHLGSLQISQKRCSARSREEKGCGGQRSPRRQAEAGHRVPGSSRVTQWVCRTQSGTGDKAICALDPFACWPTPSKQLRTVGSGEMGNRVGTDIN